MHHSMADFFRNGSLSTGFLSTENGSSRKMGSMLGPVNVSSAFFDDLNALLDLFGTRLNSLERHCFSSSVSPVVSTASFYVDFQQYSAE